MTTAAPAMDGQVAHGGGTRYIQGDLAPSFPHASDPATTGPPASGRTGAAESTTSRQQQPPSTIQVSLSGVSSLHPHPLLSPDDLQLGRPRWAASHWTFIAAGQASSQPCSACDLIINTRRIFTGAARGTAATTVRVALYGPVIEFNALACLPGAGAGAGAALPAPGALPAEGV